MKSPPSCLLCQYTELKGLVGECIRLSQCALPEPYQGVNSVFLLP